MRPPLVGGWEACKYVWVHQDPIKRVPMFDAGTGQMFKTVPDPL